MVSSAQGRLLSAGLGIAAGAVAYGVAVALGRSLTAGGETPLLTPLAVCGALALGLGVGSVVSTEVAQPQGAAHARQALAIAAPLATLIALFAYSSDAAAPARLPLASSPAASVPFPTRPVSPNDPILGQPPAPQPGTQREEI